MLGCRSHLQCGFSRGSNRDKPSLTLIIATVFNHVHIPVMPQRLKRLIGSFAIVFLAIIYAVVATTIATAKLADASGWVHMFYFLISGILWVVPAMLIISWMMKPARDKTSN